MPWVDPGYIIGIFGMINLRTHTYLLSVTQIALPPSVGFAKGVAHSALGVLGRAVLCLGIGPQFSLVAHDWQGIMGAMFTVPKRPTKLISKYHAGKEDPVNQAPLRAQTIVKGDVAVYGFVDITSTVTYTFTSTAGKVATAIRKVGVRASWQK